VAFIVAHRERIIPVEVKSGKTGTLRSLHSFVDMSGARLAVRLYHGKIERIETETPKGTPYTLLNLPYYLCSKIGEYIDTTETNT